MSRPQVVITRKDKRISHKLTHVVAFAATGGLSGIVTAAEVGSHAGYNARTARLSATPGANPKRAMRRMIKQNVDDFDPAANFRAQYEGRK